MITNYAAPAGIVANDDTTPAAIAMLRESAARFYNLFDREGWGGARADAEAFTAAANALSICLRSCGDRGLFMSTDMAVTALVSVSDRARVLAWDALRDAADLSL